MTTRPFPSFNMYQDHEGFWRWSLSLRSDQIVAVSALRFRNPEGCARAISFMQRLNHVPVWGDPTGTATTPEIDELVLSEEQIVSDYRTD